MKNEKLQRLRKIILYLWMVVMPITFNWMSPVLIVMAGFEATINISFIIFGVWFFSSLIFGRAYCAYACQWGAIQEVLANLTPKKLDKKKKNTRRRIKYVVFVIWVVFIFLGPIIAGGYINGINIFYPNPPNENNIISFTGELNGNIIFYFGIQLLIAVFFTLVSGNRSFCNYGCPMAVMGIIGTKIKNKLKYPSLHLEVDSKKCINCKKCSRECVMNINVTDMVQNNEMYNPDCIMCGNCINVCKQNVIHYAWRWK